MKLWKTTRTLDGRLPRLERARSMAEADILLVGGQAIDLEAMPRLKGLFKCGVGADNVPFGACERRGVRVGLPGPRTSGIVYEETAAFATGLVYRMLHSRVGSLECWTKVARQATRRRRALVVGMGNIGCRVERKLRGTVEAATFDVADAPLEELDGMLGEADVVTLHIPLSEANRGLFGAERLGRMKDGAALVNTARAALVDEDALYAELRSGRLRAAFDVFWQEPYRGKLAELRPDPFWMTPHVAGACEDFFASLAGDFEDFVNALRS